MLKTTIANAAAAAALVLAAMTLNSPAYAIKMWTVPNGVDFNGVDFNGKFLNGVDFNGKFLNGRKLNGRNAQGASSSARVEVVGIVLPESR